MLDILISFEIGYLFPLNENQHHNNSNSNRFVMFLLYLLPDKEWLILIFGALII